MTSDMVHGLSGKVALVTGGNQGVGRAIAKSLSAAGAHVVVASRSTPDGVDGTGGLDALRLDVTDEASCGRAVRECENRLGHLDILVNNAGIARSRKFVDTDTALWDQMMQVNVKGPLWLIRAALPAMLERGQGRVVSVGSIASRVGMPYVSAYAASKHALLGLTRSLAAEYPTSGVTFNCLCPSYVDTAMTTATVDNIVAKTGRSREDALRPLLNPQGRLVQADEIAALCTLLASDQGRSITGQAINVDGGYLQS